MTTLRRPQLCPKTMKWWPYLCPKWILWGFSSILIQTFPIVSALQYGRRSREWKSSMGKLMIPCRRSFVRKLFLSNPCPEFIIIVHHCIFILKSITFYKLIKQVKILTRRRIHTLQLTAIRTTLLSIITIKITKTFILNLKLPWACSPSFKNWTSPRLTVLVNVGCANWKKMKSRIRFRDKLISTVQK